MKRKLLALIVGASLIMSTGLTAMAAETPTAETTPANLTASIEAIEITDGTPLVTAIASTVGEIKEGLNVSHLPELGKNASKEGEAPAAYFGVISKEDLSKIISELNLSSEKAEELMAKFDKNIKVQDKLQALYNTVTGDATNEELQKIYDEADKLSSGMENIIVGDVLNKAIELELLEKVGGDEIFQISTEAFSITMTAAELLEK